MGSYRKVKQMAEKKYSNRVVNLRLKFDSTEKIKEGLEKDEISIFDVYCILDIPLSNSLPSEIGNYPPLLSKDHVERCRKLRKLHGY